MDLGDRAKQEARAELLSRAKQDARAEQKSAHAPAIYDRHGWRKCRFCIVTGMSLIRAMQDAYRDVGGRVTHGAVTEQLPGSKNLPVHPVHSSLLRITHWEVGNADFVWNKNLSMRPRYTTAMDGGSADFAGAKICQYILYIHRSCASMRPRYTVHPVHKNPPSS